MRPAVFTVYFMRLNVITLKRRLSRLNGAVRCDFAIETKFISVIHCCNTNSYLREIDRIINLFISPKLRAASGISRQFAGSSERVELVTNCLRYTLEYYKKLTSFQGSELPLCIQSV